MNKAIAKLGLLIGIVVSIITILCFFTGIFSLHKLSAGNNPPSEIDSTRTDPEKPLKDNTQIDVATGMPIINRLEISQKNTGASIIEEKSERQKAKNLVLSILSEKRWSNVEGFCDFGPCIPRHTFLGEYNLPFKEKRSTIIVVASIQDNEKYSYCHACAPHLSFFEFERTHKALQLAHADVAIIRWGSWGVFKPKSLKIIEIGDNLYGIVLKLKYMAQGVIVKSISILTRVEHSLKEVLSLTTGRDDCGHYIDGCRNVWGSKISFNKRVNGYYDILVERKGIRDRVHFSETEVFKYSGKEYVTSGISH